MSEFLPKPGQVERAEGILDAAGFDAGPADGVLDAQSGAALAEFQASLGLDPTGVLDEATYQELGRVQRRLNRNAKKGQMTVGPGQKSSSIRIIEERLATLGYDPGEVDGLYDQETVRAVRQFRRDQKELDNDSDLLGRASRRILRDEARGYRDKAPTRTRRKRSKENLRDRARANRAATREHEDGSVGVGRGSKGRSIALIQRHLRAAGFDPKHTNGVFDQRTEGAVKAFQSSVGLEESGRVDGRTWKRLRSSIILSNTDAGVRSQSVGETSHAVLRTERLLKRLGHNPGKVDGKYTERTQKAVDAFRKKHRLKGRGKGVTNATIEKMHEAEQIVSLSQLRGVMPALPVAKAKKMLPHLNKAMKKFGITKVHRIRMFLAQLAHESVQLIYFEEIHDGSDYEGRTDLGNTQPGDGRRFKGRGPIQLTGRSNYKAASGAIGVNLIKRPKLAATIRYGFQVAGWFWQSHGLNAVADGGTVSAFLRTTHIINGGENGWPDRLQFYQRARSVIR